MSEFRKVKEFEGTWEEAQERVSEFAGRKVRITVFESEDSRASEEPPNSARNILSRAEGWAGNDAEECLEEAYRHRTKARFE